MFNSFFAQMLSGSIGPSSKRGVMVWLVLLFTVLIIVDTFTGKHPIQSMMDMLFNLIWVSLVLVFGEKFLPVIQALLSRKSVSTTNIVAPPDSTVVSNTTTKETDKTV